MGYYTKYELSAWDAATRTPISMEKEYEISYRLEQIAFGHMDREEVERFGPVSFETWTEETMTWYDHETDMLTLSKEYPNLVFLLEGEGEEHGDSWKFYTYNGIAEIVYADIIFNGPNNPIFGVEKTETPEEKRIAVLEAENAQLRAELQEFKSSAFFVGFNII